MKLEVNKCCFLRIYCGENLPAILELPLICHCNKTQLVRVFQLIKKINYKSIILF